MHDEALCAGAILTTALQAPAQCSLYHLQHHSLCTEHSVCSARCVDSASLGEFTAVLMCEGHHIIEQSYDPAEGNCMVHRMRCLATETTEQEKLRLIDPLQTRSARHAPC